MMAAIIMHHCVTHDDGASPPPSRCPSSHTHTHAGQGRDGQQTVKSTTRIQTHYSPPARRPARVAHRLSDAPAEGAQLAIHHHAALRLGAGRIFGFRIFTFS
jgi:hypothetical protein